MRLTQLGLNYINNKKGFQKCASFLQDSLIYLVIIC